MAQLLRLFHTVRALRAVQIGSRLAVRLRRVRPDRRPAPGVAVAGSWDLPAWRNSSMTSPDSFRFLNEIHRLSSASDWNNAEWPRLWLYNLHYFDDLDARDAGARQSWHEGLVDRWIAENPPVQGVGWEPYCLALRIVNWCRWAWRGATLSEAWRESLAIQARALREQLEFHLLGNHLWADAKALAFAGLFFDGAEARAWLDTASALLRRELKEQVLSDGGHFERSPMYHNIVCMDVLELIQADRLAPGGLDGELRRALAEVAPRMVFWAEAMSHPDGQPAFFNDTAMGVAPTAGDLRAAAEHLRLPLRPPPSNGLTWLEASGYVRAQQARATVIADLAPVGPDYIPGHGHADTLSLEVSVDGQRVLVNTGVSTYDLGVRRSFERSTSAHNTVEVDGKNSSDVWASFRVGRRARVLSAVAWCEPGRIHCTGSHDGYVRFGSKLVHCRTWTLTEDRLVVRDQVSGRASKIVARWWLHPSANLDVAEGARLQCELASGAVVSAQFSGGKPQVESGAWAPEFGKLVPNLGIELTFEGHELNSTWSW